MRSSSFSESIILNPAISACNIRIHKNNPPYGCLNWNHFYFHFGSATLPYKHTLACPQELVPQTLVFTCLPPLNVLVRILSFPFSLFFGFPEISAPATSDFHLSPPPSSCFFFLIHPLPSPMHVLAPLSLCLLQLACPLPWNSSGIHCPCFDPQAAGFVSSIPVVSWSNTAHLSKVFHPTCSPFLDSSSIPFLIPHNSPGNLSPASSLNPPSP